MNIHSYLKHRIPIMHRQCFRLLSQNPEYEITHCNDFDILFNFQFVNGIQTINHAKNCT